MVTIQDGQTCFLWNDLLNGVVYSQVFPELFSFVKSQHTSLALAVSNPHFYELFHLPLTPEAYEQFVSLSEIIQGMQLQDTHDVWAYSWGSSNFISSRAYKKIVGHRHIHQAFRWLWKCSCQNKRKFFFWLILQGKLNTRSRLKQRNMHLPDYNCVLCHYNVEEDIAHMLFHCPFSLACWTSLNTLVPSTLETGDIIQDLKLQLHLPFAMEIIVTMC